MELKEIFEQIEAEVYRQNHKFKREFGKWNDHTDKKYRILGEEVGEVAMALNDEDYENLPVELVQVAALCVNWLQSDH